MNIRLFLFLFFVSGIALPVFSQQPPGDKDKMVEQLIKSGYLRKEGNLLIFKVQKASDTPKIKMMYGSLFNNTTYTIAFDVDGQYFKKNTIPDGKSIQPADTKTNNECITDINIITAERMQQKGTIQLQGKTMRFNYARPADTSQFRSLYPCKVRYQDVVYDVMFYSKGASSARDTLIAVAPVANIPTAPIQRFEVLRNPGFEMGYPVPHWKKLGDAFKEPHETHSLITWKDMKVVTVGGDYWKDLDFYRGQRSRSWITSLKRMQGGDWELRRLNGSSATGSLISEPFKIYSFQKFISFLIGGGNDINNLKVELLQVKVQPAISGDIGISSGRIPGTESRPIRTSLDTIYVPIAGIDPKTGHNNELFRREWWNISRLDTSAYYVIAITDKSTAHSGWGFINVDDFLFLPRNPLSYRGEDSLRIHNIVVKDFVSNADQEVYVDFYTPLFGSADTHTHS